MKNSIKVNRAKLNITQGALADAVGVTRQAINAIELGKYVPSTALAIKIARLFHEPVENVFFLEDGD